MQYLGIRSENRHVVKNAETRFINIFIKVNVL